jgi:protocatechuate 3,4-dioxygenase beta subunit
MISHLSKREQYREIIRAAVIPSLFLLILAIPVIVTHAQQERSGQAQNPAGEPSSGAGSIKGLVLSNSGRPLANVRIAILPASRPNSKDQAYYHSGDRVTNTDKEGRFQVDDISPGLYSLFIRAAGYTYMRDPGDSLGPTCRPGDSLTITLMKGGVITGRVTNSKGDPVVGTMVRATRVRDIDGRPIKNIIAYSHNMGFRTTDDRGNYRIYGLEPGSYLVYAEEEPHVLSQQGFNSNFYNNNPTRSYFPSATRNKAEEVLVRAGEERNGINIRYRSERGYKISGSISGVVGPDSSKNFIDLALFHAPNGAQEGKRILLRENSRSFTFENVDDGDYYLTATCVSLTSNTTVNYNSYAAGRISVKGTNVAGIELKLLPLGSINGRVVMETAQRADGKTICGSERRIPLKEILITVQQERDEQALYLSNTLNPYYFDFKESAPNDKGELEFPVLKPGRYFLKAVLPSPNLYMRAISLPTRGQSPVYSGNNILLKEGEQIKDLIITIAEGAAELSGQVVFAKEGEQLPARLRVHLVPAEKEQADNALRFAETEVRNGEFKFSNIAPGGYWLIARPEGESTDRSLLRREAAAANTVIDLPTCKRVADYVLRYKN